MKIEILKDGMKLYTYTMAYVDDLLIISKDPKFCMGEIASQFRLKQDNIAPPPRCLLVYKYI